MANLSPMMQHYVATKQQNPDAILFYRLGDFYEMFFEDAVTVSQELELTLTGKECGLPERAPMCGVPWHSADTYIAKLIEKGYKVAICEQVEDPKQAKGLVKREVVRIITPGTVTDHNALQEKRNNFLYSVYIKGKQSSLAACDLTTGEFFVREFSNGKDGILLALSAETPGEIITADREALFTINAYIQQVPESYFSLDKSRNALKSHFAVQSLDALGLNSPTLIKAAGALIIYLQDTQKVSLPHINHIKIINSGDTMPLPEATRRNLEITESLRNKNLKGSLLWVLDKTVTAMGGRLLRNWVEQPLLNKDKILTRLRAVQELKNNVVLQQEIIEILKKVYDMERLLSRISFGSFNARDALALLRSLKQVHPIKNLLSQSTSLGIKNAVSLLVPLDDIEALLYSSINEDAPVTITDGNIIKKGYSKELDELRDASLLGRQWLLDLEEEEKKKTGIKNLKIQYNRVFGYYIEVTKSNYALVPERYERRQTLANSERYTTEKLREIESKIVGADEKSVQLEYKLFIEIRERLSQDIALLQKTAEGFKTIDALLSLSLAALENDYVCPNINTEGNLHIVKGRHPVVEKTIKDSSFVPNDTLLNQDDSRMLIVTGPNMGGKSTYMRQTAIIALMAHMGSFVPAEEADIPLSDNIYTRIGASDDLAGGQSTFMVEMNELSYILRNATSNSLIILDEIGRGTGTLDGLSIAWAAVEYLADKTKCGAKTMFATHYHELSELEGNMDGVKNVSVAVKEMGEEAVFLHTIVQGGADKSFGVYVAKLAGLPKQLLHRARQIQARLEANNINAGSLAAGIMEKNRGDKQVSIMDIGKTELIEEVANLDVFNMNPVEALNYLYLLKEKARKL
ncbi:MAG: DNA mismatch repair protein MutS [Eubacteriales bacterium]|nr:DNA mismatch repair protein MutS [Eubacteriales bacterium]